MGVDYTVKREDEGACHNCGTPLYVGDRAYESDGYVYCCKECAEHDHGELADSYR